MACFPHGNLKVIQRIHTANNVIKENHNFYMSTLDFTGEVPSRTFYTFNEI
jgi:hypothetical protein